MSNYPSPPGHRMAYDRDGSVGFLLDDTNAVTQLTTANLQALNNESIDGYTFPSSPGFGNLQAVGLILPQPHDLVGYFVCAPTGGTDATVNRIDVSADTTTGADGTWTQVTAAMVNSQTVSPGYRNAIQGIAQPGIKGMRFFIKFNSSDNITIEAIHLYGDITAGDEGDILQAWDLAVDQRIAPAALDYGDVPRSNVTVKQMRFKNRSATKTANNVAVGIEALTDTAPTVAGQYAFSTDGVTYAATVTIAAIAPGAISPIIYVKRATDPAAVLSVWAARVTAVPGSWT